MGFSPDLTDYDEKKLKGKQAVPDSRLDTFFNLKIIDPETTRLGAGTDNIYILYTLLSNLIPT